ncbi:hypothetical protein [uncultured Helicobacter sp.]
MARHRWFNVAGGFVESVSLLGGVDEATTLKRTLDSKNHCMNA